MYRLKYKKTLFNMEKVKQKCGRKQIYGEETVTFSIAVPKSKKETIKTFVESLLKTYKTKL